MIRDDTGSAELADIEDIYRLTPMQNGLLFHTLRAEQSGPYVEQFVFDAVGHLDPALLAESWTEVVNRHPALRTAFVWEGVDDPVQVVVKSCRVPFTAHDLTGKEATEVDDVVAGFLRDDRLRGFTLAEAPLMRLTLFEHDRGAVVVWTLHHLIMDGWSMPITISEVAATYRAAAGDRADLPPARPFRDFVDWLGDEDREAPLKYWRTHLDGMTATALDPVRPGLPGEQRGTATAGRGYLDLSADLTTALTTAARAAKVTLSTVYQAAWALLLARHNDATDVSFGVTVSGRPTEIPDIDTMVGVLINTVPRRITVNDSASVASWLREVQATHLDSLPHQHIGLVEIQTCTAVPAGDAMFDSIVVFENYPSENPDFDLGEAKLVVREVIEDAGYPMTLTVLPRQPRSRLQLLYDVDRFPDEAIRTFLGRFEAVLAGLVTDLEAPVGGIDATTAESAGTALDGHGVRVLDHRGRPAPAGVPGRVHVVAGALARRAAAGSLVTSADGTLVHDTGLLGVLRPDGVVEFLDGKAPVRAETRPADTPAPAPPTTGDQDYFARPTTRLVRALWQEVLAVRVVKPNSDFFKQGGDSLSAVRLTGRLRNTLGTTIAVNAVFDERSLRGIVSRVDADLGGATAADERAAVVLGDLLLQERAAEGA